MDLLTAVNRILPVLGEHPVTSLDTKHPTLAILLPKVDTKIEDLTTQGYWFNAFNTTLYPDTGGGIAVPVGTLSFVPDTVPAVVRGTRLYNPTTMTYVFDSAVAGKIAMRLAFEELPEVVAQYVWYSVLVDAYVTDIGFESNVQVWQAQVQQAQSRMMSEHLRNMKYSTAASARFQRLRRAMRA